MELERFLPLCCIAAAALLGVAIYIAIVKSNVPPEGKKPAKPAPPPDDRPPGPSGPPRV